MKYPGKYLSDWLLALQWSDPGFHNPDVVHTRNWGGLDGIIAARLAGIRGDRAPGSHQGPPTLFRAFAQVAHSMPDIRLMVIGDGPEWQKK